MHVVRRRRAHNASKVPLLPRFLDAINVIFANLLTHCLSFYAVPFRDIRARDVVTVQDRHGRTVRQRGLKAHHCEPCSLDKVCQHAVDVTLGTPGAGRASVAHWVQPRELDEEHGIRTDCLVKVPTLTCNSSQELGIVWTLARGIHMGLQGNVTSGSPVQAARRRGAASSCA